MIVGSESFGNRTASAVLERLQKIRFCVAWLDSHAVSILQELVCDSESLVSLRDRPSTFTFQACKRPYRINVLRNYDALVVDLVDHIRFAIGHVEYVFPVSHFPHVGPGSVKVSH